ncbi:Uma2 family endonuclease [Synechocystis sp. FACHB-383]|uniref:Uma2 family endonuclease n=1 Tax=Synechocystis sp. FACHB-383 TaxID=2692864 RepID=UPI00168502A4|nr:Uma2 family endonuclease [Synechocystis sp. FACHB-383]MBD2652511.1 Uma2 family endonuclease [Synechocystis sp. FACHB-383]
MFEHLVKRLEWVVTEQSIFVYQPDRSPEIFDEIESKLLTPSFAQAVDLTLGEVCGWLIK